MKLTKTRLLQLIKEELQNVLKEKEWHEQEMTEDERSIAHMLVVQYGMAAGEADTLAKAQQLAADLAAAGKTIEDAYYDENLVAQLTGLEAISIGKGSAPARPNLGKRPRPTWDSDQKDSDYETN